MDQIAVAVALITVVGEAAVTVEDAVVAVMVVTGVVMAVAGSLLPVLLLLKLVVWMERPRLDEVMPVLNVSRRTIKSGNVRMFVLAKPPSFPRRCVHARRPPLRRACAVCKW